MISTVYINFFVIYEKIDSSLLAFIMLFNFVGSTFADIKENDNQNIQFTDEELLNMDLAEVYLDDRVYRYIDTFNPDIDFDMLLAMEEEISLEDSLIPKEPTRVTRNPVVIAVLIQGTAQLLKRYGIPAVKATYHLGLRIYQRSVSPNQVINSITKGKRYYDPYL